MPKQGPKVTRVRRHYTEQFKRDAVAMVSKERSVTSVPRELGLARSLLQ
jgi:transposase-like protein